MHTFVIQILVNDWKDIIAEDYHALGSVCLSDVLLTFISLIWAINE